MLVQRLLTAQAWLRWSHPPYHLGYAGASVYESAATDTRNTHICRFDGDGMVHGVRIKDGRASYHNRFVQTSRFKQEKMLGHASFMKVLHACVPQVTSFRVLGFVLKSLSHLS